MKVQSGYRYRLELTPRQRRQMESCGGACRWVWNHFLSYREEAYLAARAAGGRLPKGAFSFAWLCRELTRLRKQIPWLAQVSVSALQQALRAFDRAFQNFFNGAQSHPTHKRREGRDSFRLIAPRDVRVEGDWVMVPKAGWIRFRKSRDLPGRLVNATISNEGGHWFIAFGVEYEMQPGIPTGPAIGLDLGIAQSVTTSMGEVFHLPVPTRRETAFQGRLAKAVSRKQRGSARRRRALSRLNKFRRHLVARRKDAAHKLTSRLARNHCEIHIEDLQVANMTRSAKGTIEEPGQNVRAKAGLNRQLLAQAHAETIRFLEYKSLRSGSRVVRKEPRFSSQECSVCHHIAQGNRPSQAVFLCLKCDSSMNADHNAAIVILNRTAGGPPVAARRRLSPKTPNEARTRPYRPAPAGLSRESAPIPITG